MPTTAEDIDARRARLSAWLTDTCLVGATDVEVANLAAPAGSGFSNDTLVFEVSYRENGESRNRRLVARLQQATSLLFPEYDLDLQYRVMQTLGEHTDVPVPVMLEYEPDPEVLGAPFFVMEYLDGRIPRDDPVFTAEGWLLGLTPAEQGRLADNALRTLAKIHDVDWKTLGLEAVVGDGGAADTVGYHVEQYRRYYEWVLEESEPNPVIDAAFEWIEEHIPAVAGPVVLSWGDARIGNMVFAPDLAVAGVLDWEMAALASPGLDLGWWTFALRYFTDGLGFSMPPGFPSLEEVLARYEELTGYQAEHHAFYEILTGTRAAIIMHRIAELSIRAGGLPEDSDMAVNNGGTRVLARLLDIPTGGPPPQTFKKY